MNRKIWIGLIIGAVVLAQPPALRKGISVEMAATTSATVMREADRTDAQIVAVTRNGTVYLEAVPVSLAGLTDALRSGSARIYLKADAGASYASVAGALGAIRATGATTTNLLTSQRDPAGGRDAPPMGIEVYFGGLPVSSEKAVVLDVAGSVLFGDVVRLIEAARASGTRVSLK
jgi:biopolymer transport protein ExbD